MGMSFHRSHGMPWRGVAVTTGIAAVGAALMVGTSASSTLDAQPPVTAPGVTLTADEQQSAAVAQSVPAATPVLYGFTPPAAASTAAPQFRIAADLPNGPLGIPGVVLQAYKLAATRVAAESPQCKLPWYLLAGIGRIESGHAGGGNVNEYGNTRTAIRGPVLDGSLAGNEVITDTDGGRWDGDGKHDRAMGPMQFIPSTWASWGSDANGDGKADPDNIFDATFSAGRYLCAGVTDIMAEPTRVGAVLRYNRSVAYANNVLGWAGAYATGVVPTGGIPEMSHSAPDDKDKDKKKSDKKDDKDKKAQDKPGSDKQSGDKPGGDKPDKSTKPKPKPTTPPQNCLGAICLPPGVGPAPAPQQKPAPAKPKATSPAPKPANGR